MTEFKLTSTDHFLKDAKNLSNTILSSVTPEQIAEYELEYSKVSEGMADDYSKIDTIKHSVHGKIVSVFGYNKEAKYIERTFAKGENLVEKHYSQFPRPVRVSEMVDSAKEKVKSQGAITGVSMSDRDIENIDESIKYLSKMGLTYGSDFNAHNACEIALAFTADEFSRLSKEEQVNSLIHLVEPCDHCGERIKDVKNGKITGIFVTSCNCWNGDKMFALSNIKPFTFTQKN